jgi:hypothetical protein
MAEIVKITKDQPFVLYVPLVILNGDGSKEVVDAASLSNVLVKLQSACGETESTFSTFDHYLVLDLPATLTTGVHAVIITANLPQGRQFALRIKRAFEVVDWDFQSNWRDYLVGDHIELTDQPFIAGVFATDADIERLKEELRQQKAAAAQAQAEAEVAKAEWEQKAAELDGVAQEETSQSILTAVWNIDFSTLAKQGDNPAATNSAILEAMSHISPTDPNSLALAQFFGVTLLEGYEFMQDTEVCDELEDIMQLVDPTLTAAQAAAITAQTLNPSES